MSKHLILYSTTACHLCEEAELLLNHAKLEWQTIEIADSDELLDRYSLKIPVLYDSVTKRELCWPFSSNDISAFISQ